MLGLCLMPGPGPVRASGFGFPAPSAGAVLSQFPPVNAVLGCFCHVAFANTSLPLPNTSRSGPQGVPAFVPATSQKCLLLKNGVEQSPSCKRASGRKNSLMPPWSCLNSVGLRSPASWEGRVVLAVGLRRDSPVSWAYGLRPGVLAVPGSTGHCWIL